MKKTKKNEKKAVQKAQPLVIVMMGFPGSGKSTCSGDVVKGFKKKHNIEVVVASQDELGSADMCKRVVEKCVKSGTVCIVDRTNIHPKERKMWATHARSFDETCRFALIWMDAPAELCIERVKSRKNHPTLQAEQADEAVASFAKGFKPPEDWELGGGVKYEKMLRGYPGSETYSGLVDSVVELYTEKKK